MTLPLPKNVYKRQRNELQILHEVANICAEATSEDLLIERVTVLLGEVLYPDNFGLALQDEEGILRVHPSYRDDPTIVQPDHIPLDHSICGQVIRTGKPLRLGDVRDFHGYFQVDDQMLSEICVPLKIGEHVFGVINAESRMLNAFRKEDERLLMTIASQIAVAISNVRLLTSEAERRKEAEILQRATEALNSSLNLDEVLEVILLYLEQVVPYDSACVFLAEGAFFRVVAARGFENSDEVLDKAYPVDDVLYNLIRKARKAIFLKDASTDPRFNAWGKSTYVRGWMGVPLLRDDKVIGCLTVDSRTSDVYGDSQAELAQSFAHQASLAIKNAQLFAETQRQNRELLALYDTTIMLGNVLDLDELLQRVGEQVYLLMAPDSMGIFLHDEKDQTLEIALVIEKGLRLKELIGLCYPVSDGGLVSWLVQNRKSMLFDDLLTETPPVTPKQVNHPARSWLGVPIFIRSQLSGVITVQSFEPEAFDAAHVRFMEAMAAQVAIAMENTILFEETRRRAQHLSILNDLSREMTALLEPQALGQLVTQRIQEAFGYFSVSLTQLEPDGQNLLVIGISGGFADRIKPGVNQLTVGKGVIGRTAKTCQISLVNDTSQDPDFFIFEDLTVNSELAVPIISNGKLLGVLNLDSDRLNAFDHTDVRLMATIADQLAIALENAHAYQQIRAAMSETQKHVQELSMLFHVGRAIANAPFNLEEIGKIVVRQFVEVLGIKECSISLLGPEHNNLWTLVDYYLQDGIGVFDQEWTGKFVALQDYPATQEVIRSMKTLVIHTSDPQAEPTELAYMHSRGLATLVIIPLVVKGHAIGVLELETGPEERHYPDQELNLAITLANQVAIALENARLYEELEESYVQTVLALARAMDARDTYTADHSQRLAAWAEAIVRKLACSPDEVRAIYWAALLHDIGKLGVPDEILRKPGPLNDVEWVIMKKHPEAGADIVAPVKRMAEVAPIIRAHQERFDGSGYPDGLRGAEIPLGARILAVVDSYSAITDDRVYRKARPHPEAILEIQKNAGKDYDPVVIEAFLELMQQEHEKGSFGPVRAVKEST